MLWVVQGTCNTIYCTSYKQKHINLTKTENWCTVLLLFIFTCTLYRPVAVYIHMYIVPSCFAVYIHMYIVPSCFAVYIHMYIVPSCCCLYSHVHCTILLCRLYSHVHCATCSSCLIVGQYFKLVLEFLWKLVKNIFLKYNWFSRI